MDEVIGFVWNVLLTYFRQKVKVYSYKSSFKLRFFIRTSFTKFTLHRPSRFGFYVMFRTKSVYITHYSYVLIYCPNYTIFYLSKLA